MLPRSASTTTMQVARTDAEDHRDDTRHEAHQERVTGVMERTRYSVENPNRSQQRTRRLGPNTVRVAGDRRVVVNYFARQFM